MKQKICFLTIVNQTLKKDFPVLFLDLCAFLRHQKSPVWQPLSENEGDHSRARWRPRRGVGVHRNGGWAAGGFRRLDLRSFRPLAHVLSAQAATKIIAENRRPGRTGSALQPAESDARLANAWTPNHTHLQHRAALGSIGWRGAQRPQCRYKFRSCSRR